MSDYKLSRDLKNGDEKAYIKAVSLYSDKLFAYALSLSGDHATADDLVQEVFIKLYEYRKKINPNYSLQSFLYKSLYHNFIDLYYKNKSRSKLHDSYLKLLDQIVNDTPIEEFEIKLKKIIANIEKLQIKLAGSSLAHSQKSMKTSDNQQNFTGIFSKKSKISS